MNCTSHTITPACENVIFTMTRPSGARSSADGQGKERMNTAHEKAIGKNGFEAIEREEHLDSHPKMTCDLQGELQAWVVVAAFEIANGLIVDPDRF